MSTSDAAPFEFTDTLRSVTVTLSALPASDDTAQAQVEIARQ